MYVRSFIVISIVFLALSSQSQSGEKVPDPLVKLGYTESEVVNSGRVPLEFSVAQIAEENRDPFKIDRGSITPAEGPAGVGDLAVDNTSSPHGRRIQGSRGYGIRSVEKNADLDELRSLTVAGWFRLVSNVRERGGGARLLCTQANQRTGGGIDIILESSGKMSFRISQSSTETASRVFPDDGEWAFYAVTFDGTQSSDNVVFYRGAVNGGVEEIDREYLDVRDTGKGSVLVVGDHVMGGRSFSGHLGKIWIFGSQDSDEGALSAEQLESIRKQSLN